MLGVDDAIAVALTAFVGKTDKGGQPYILHCLWVMFQLNQRDSEQLQAGVMHDVVEDSDITLDDLHAMGFSPRVVATVDLLTHRKGVSYDDYITRIANSNNLDAIRIKIADLTHNMDLSRLGRIAKQSDWDRANKYREARDLLYSRYPSLKAVHEATDKRRSDSICRE